MPVTVNVHGPFASQKPVRGIPMEVETVALSLACSPLQSISPSIPTSHCGANCQLYLAWPPATAPLHVRAIRLCERGGARKNSGDAGAVPVAPAVTDIAADIETGPIPRRRDRRRTRPIDGYDADKDRDGRNEKLLHGRLLDPQSCPVGQPLAG